MKFIKYSKYVADPAGEMSMEELLSALSDYLLQSGFQDSWYYYDFKDGEQTLDELRQAIQQALESGELLERTCVNRSSKCGPTVSSTSSSRS